ncbi:hypothetical protein ACZ91_41330 [Streptomyces regensis]|nr:hypothetical protein ACZ91_41330 [Streptomyces regensis]
MFKAVRGVEDQVVGELVDRPVGTDGEGGELLGDDDAGGFGGADSEVGVDLVHTVDRTEGHARRS